MAEVFISKARPLGTSIGLIIPSEIVKREGIVPGEEVEVAILKRDFSLLDKLMGSMRGAGPFVRDRRARV